jgi:hypothetical protein
LLILPLLIFLTLFVATLTISLRVGDVAAAEEYKPANHQRKSRLFEVFRLHIIPQFPK